MTEQSQKSISITLTGTGTSAGVPMIGCDCRTCTSTDPRDRRDRCGALVRYTDDHGLERTFLIDTPPDLRWQMLRHGVCRVDGVVYTHNHADHIFGMDDLRRFNAVQREPINLFAEPDVVRWMQETFVYIFQSHRNVNQSYVPQLVLNPIEPDGTFDLAGRTWRAIRLYHGRLPILGFRVGDIAYCTDCSAIPPRAYAQLEGLDVLVLDGLRYRHHPTHLTVDQALAVIEQLKPRRAYLTHIAHDILHADLEPRLPEGVHLAYDGLTLEA